MALDPVPSFIGGGAQHGAPVIQLGNYYATGGQEGVGGALDLRALALSTPGPQIQLMPGTVAIRNRATDGARRTYLDRAPSAFTVDIAATDSSGPRSDLVMIRVENPQATGESQTWGPPPSIQNGPYIYARVEPDVPTTTTTLAELGLIYSAIPVCRVDMPVSTATVLDEYITDLRTVANPYTGVQPAPDVINNYYEVTNVIESTAPGQFIESTLCDSGSQLLSTHNTFRRFPNEASWSVVIPSWANGADVFVILNPRQHEGHVFGEMRLNIGGATDGNVPTKFDMDAISSTKPNRIPTIVAGTYPIPSSVRGRKVTVQLEGRQFDDAATTGYFDANVGTYVYISMTFKQRPSYD